ncbi:hypothetical protein N6H14_13035 [Paenibacillus sp. CC-CFT747]|nr:hypothetical protein N6H14_13035 [Paenibacillus sp. CC-CFT747]
MMMKLCLCGTLIKYRWPSIVALVIAASGLPTTTVQPLAQILILAALFYPIAGAIRGHMRGAGPITAQVGGLLIFAGIAAAAMMAGRKRGFFSSS